MPVIQISKVIHCLGTSGELPDRLELGQLGFTTDTADVLIGAAGLPQVAGRKSYPYQNLKILTELDVQKTMTGDVYHAGPLYKQDLITATGVMDVPLFKRNATYPAQYGTYDYSFTSSQTSQMGIIHVALNGVTPHVVRTANVWGLITDTTFSFSTLLIGDQVMLRISWTPAALGQEIYTFHMAGREWNALVELSTETPPPLPKPTKILNLAATAMSPTTVQLTYTNAEGAIAHEYRLNGGAINPVPGGKLIANLNPGTLYNFEVRGVNANGNGDWSNVASATTPGVVQSYPDSYTVVQGKVLTVVAPGVLQNDTNAFGLSQTAEVVSAPTHGSLSLSSTGGFTYTPFSSFVGTDTFTYRAFDGTRYGAPATVTLTVTANPVPVAGNNNYTMNENTVLVTTASTGVMNNDSDPNGDTLTVSLVSNVAHGTLNLNSSTGAFSYTPVTDFVGVDSFTYRAYDGVNYSPNATVTITVNDVAAPNITPVSASDSYVVNQDTVLSVSAINGVLKNDTDANNDTLSVAISFAPSHGSLIMNSNGSFTYTPVAGYYGPDSFTYRATDGIAVGNTATVSITVNQVQVNRAPTASGNSYTIAEDATLSVPAAGVLSNDTDPDGDTLSAILVSNVSQGTLTLQSNGSFVYKPNANYNGNDSFTYKVSDGALDGNTVTVNIQVTPVNDPDARQMLNSGIYVVNPNPFATNGGVAYGLYPDGTVKTNSASVTPANVLQTWLENTTDGVVNSPGAWEIMFSTASTYAGLGGSQRGVWHNLAQARYISLQPLAAINISASITVSIRAAGTTTVLNTATIILECDAADTSGGGGGGGGAGCVWTGAYLADNSFVGDVTVGHELAIITDDGLGYRSDVVRNVRFQMEPCATLTTESGITLTCSYSTPITIWKETVPFTIPLVECLGELVPVLDNGEYRWEAITDIEGAGDRMVALINANDATYAAGDEQDRFIFTHNMSAFEGTSPDKV